MTDNTANPQSAPARGGLRARRNLRSLSGVAIAVAALAFGGEAAAQSDGARSAARVAAEAGDAAFKAGKYQEAADYFERAESMMHAPTLLLFAARSHMKLGHYVKAREAYIRVVRERMTPNSPPAFLAAQEAAKAELPDAEKRLGKATIKVDGPERAALQVTLDGAPAPAEMIGLPAPMDPGRHSVQIAAEGWEPGSADFTVEEQKASEVVVHLKKSLTAVVPVAGGAVPAGGSAGNDPPGGDTAPPAGVNQGMRIGSYVAFGVGAVGVGLGTFFLVQKGSKNDDADAKFDEYGCANTPRPDCGPDQEKEIAALGDDAASSATLSAVSFVAGGVALVTGVTLFVLSGSSSSSSGQTHVTPYFTGTSAGLLGRF